MTILKAAILVMFFFTFGALLGAQGETSWTMLGYVLFAIVAMELGFLFYGFML